MDELLKSPDPKPGMCIKRCHRGLNSLRFRQVLRRSSNDQETGFSSREWEFNSPPPCQQIFRLVNFLTSLAGTITQVAENPPFKREVGVSITPRPTKFCTGNHFL